jgi:hypothetical protein
MWAVVMIFLVLAAVTISLAHVTTTWARISRDHKQASATFLAEAGIQMAGQRLLTDRNYSGQAGVKLPTGSFDVKVTRSPTGYNVTSIGFAESAVSVGRKKSIRAVVVVTGARSFKVTDWKE